MMYWKKIFTASFGALIKNKMRCALTMLGIIIGVAAVITMQAVGIGTQQDVQEQISSLGVNMIVVTPSATTQQGVRSAAGSAKIFKTKHADELANHCTSLLHVSPFMMTPAQIKYGSKNWRTSVNGAYANYLSIRNLNIKSGSMWKPEQDKSASQVCIIGQTISNNLFGKKIDPIGKTIRINHIPLKVIGLLKEKGQSMGQDQDDIVIVPILTLQKRMIEEEYIQQIFASAKSENHVNEAVAEIEQYLKVELLKEKKQSVNFSIHTSSEMSETAGSITRSLSYLLAAMASISLVVGGVGIMNIMLVSVTERTREIGVRLAIGATPFDVWVQILIESVVLSITAGIIGIGLGLLLCYFISETLGWTTVITISSIVLSFFVSTMVGIFFGWYPARKAAAMDPIEALRYE